MSPRHHSLNRHPQPIAPASKTIDRHTRTALELVHGDNAITVEVKVSEHHAEVLYRHLGEATAYRTRAKEMANANSTTRCSMIMNLFLVLPHNAGEDAIDRLHDDVQVVEGELALWQTHAQIALPSH